MFFLSVYDPDWSELPFLGNVVSVSLPAKAGENPWLRLLLSIEIRQ